MHLWPPTVTYHLTLLQGRTHGGGIWILIWMSRMDRFQMESLMMTQVVQESSMGSLPCRRRSHSHHRRRHRHCRRLPRHHLHARLRLLMILVNCLLQENFSQENQMLQQDSRHQQGLRQ